MTPATQILECTVCGGTDFRITHSTEDAPRVWSIYTLGTVCAGCGKKSLIVWTMDPAPDPAGGIRWI